MAFSVLSTGRREVVGDLFERRFTIDEVDGTGSSVDLRPYGVRFIDSVSYVNTEATNAVQIRKNATTDTATEASPGQIFIKNNSATDDIAVTVRWR